MEVHIYSVKTNSQACNIWAKDMTTKKRGSHKKNQLGILTIYPFCQKLQQRASGPGDRPGIYLWQYTRKVAPTLLIGLRKGAARA